MRDDARPPSAPPGSALSAGAALGTTGEMRQLGAGTQLGRYTLLRRIAAGGMAEVYAARSGGLSGFERKVAIKKILPQYSLNERFIAMLVDEAKITVRLAHPNIAQVYELGLEDQTYYIVMEFVEGRPLNRLLQKIDARGHSTMPLEHAVHIVAEVAKGLHHAHNQRDLRGQPLAIVHRDVSPQNVLISYAGDVKLIDFGIARAAGKASQTTVGTIKGKLRYLAPEIAMGLEPDHRADVFCCGIVLFELLTGEAMFAPRTDIEAIELATAAKIRSPRLSNPAIPPELETIVMRALQRDRDQRYPSAKALHTDLRRFLNTHAPNFVGHELADYMHTLFAAEQEEDARLDALAERAIQHDGGPIPGAGAAGSGEIELPPAERSRSGGYREIVTRAEISVLGTQDIEALDDDSLEHTEAAAPAGPPRTGSGRTEAPRTGSGRTEAPRTGSGRTEAPRTGPDRSGPAPEASRPELVTPRRRPLAALTVTVGVLGALVVAFLASREPEAPRSIAPNGESVAIEPQPTAPSSAGQAVVVIQVRPAVPVDVRARGRLVLQAARPPVRLSLEAAPGESVELELSARGHEPRREVRVLSPGNESALEVELIPLEGALVLAGLDVGAKVELDRGRLEGDRVTGLRFGDTVRLRVSRAGLRDAEVVVKVDDVDPIRVEIPRGEALPTGKLSVAARPFAEVLVNGRSLGRTPLLKALPVGSYKLVLRREGGEHRYDVVIRAGQTSTILHQWPR